MWMIVEPMRLDEVTKEVLGRREEQRPQSKPSTQPWGTTSFEGQTDEDIPGQETTTTASFSEYI